MGTPYKMKGSPMYKTGPGTKAPITKAQKRANLLKAVPNVAAYNKLSSADKKGFDAAGKRAGLPQKKAPILSVCGPGGKSNTGAKCGNFKNKKKGTVVSRLANKVVKGVKNTTKKINKSVTKKIKTTSRNIALNKNTKGSNKTVRYL